MRDSLYPSLATCNKVTGNENHEWKHVRYNRVLPYILTECALPIKQHKCEFMKTLPVVALDVFNLETVEAVSDDSV